MTFPAAVRSCLTSRRARLLACVALVVALAPIADLVEREPADARPYAGRKVTFEVSGAQGGRNGGRGAVIQATAELAPGTRVGVTVGGTDGYNGGGAPGSSHYGTPGAGGGASDVRIDGMRLSSRVLVAAGGGGRGGQRYSGTPAGRGGIGTATGRGGNGSGGRGSSSGDGGRGATMSAGGAGGSRGCSWLSCARSGGSGQVSSGGAGGEGTTSSLTGRGSGGGGGGGGYFGGGGAGGSCCRSGAGGGGGGTSYVKPSTFPARPSDATSSGTRSGNGRVRVSLDGGATWVATYEYSGSAQFYTVPWSPSVDSLDVTAGPITGDTSVTLTGQHLSDVNGVSFCGTAGGSLAVVSDTMVTVQTPAGSVGSCDVVVQTNVSGSTSLRGAFFYYAVPSVATASPSAGPVSGGSIDLAGSGFSGAEEVTIGGQKATFTVNSDTSITATAPAAAAGDAAIAVTTKHTTGTGPATFTYTEAPTIAAVAPQVGPIAGGTSVTITGANLGPATAVGFGATPAASLTVDSPTQITAIAPPLGAGASDVSVTTPGGTAVESEAFRAYAQPAVTALSSPIGPSAGGGTLVVTGTNLADVDAVEFGGRAADSFTVDSDTQLTVITPIGDPGVAELVVSNPVFASEPAVFAFLEPMAVALVDGSTEIEPGSDLEISGGGFAPNTEIDLELRSKPRYLGTVSSDDVGRFAATVEIPADTDAGAHLLVATGIDPFGEVQSVSLDVEVLALRQSAVRADPASPSAEAVPSSLAATGRGFGIAVRSGLIMLILGALMVSAGQRRVMVRRPRP